MACSVEVNCFWPLRGKGVPFPLQWKGFLNSLDWCWGLKRESECFFSFFSLATWINILMSLHQYRPCRFCKPMPHCTGDSYKLLGSGPINLLTYHFVPCSECSVGLATLLWGARCLGFHEAPELGCFHLLGSGELWFSRLLGQRPTWPCLHVMGGVGKLCLWPLQQGLSWGYTHGQFPAPACSCQVFAVSG